MKYLFPRKLRPCTLAAVAFWLACAFGAPGSAQAFYQTTSLEGSIAPEASGVWLSVAHVMPTFQVRHNQGALLVIPH